MASISSFSAMGASPLSKRPRREARFCAEHSQNDRFRAAKCLVCTAVLIQASLAPLGLLDQKALVNDFASNSIAICVLMAYLRCSAALVPSSAARFLQNQEKRKNGSGVAAK